jgi:hypothetical protein
MKGRIIRLNGKLRKHINNLRHCRIPTALGAAHHISFRRLSAAPSAVGAYHILR